MYSSSAVPRDAVWADMKNKKGKRKITKTILQTYREE